MTVNGPWDCRSLEQAPVNGDEKVHVVEVPNTAERDVLLTKAWWWTGEAVVADNVSADGPRRFGVVDHRHHRVMKA